ncbi:ATP-binding cassette domain-containing protein [Lentilactobacillus diolivorans]|uniref:ABC superfamily ATP binding cassette transporter, ABC protein n=2 Tax=Lentilactobacillus diolivorans TaxID=179838 RepID=A0A0R1SBN3_9LACO|nr:ABC transporter ATP-binding protein [Lentilactobacillus diolivorans]KRL64090.1 ABC superfamily ATP binding cassette transporter, ABC protein [Lentilactobacillus diolivorans DSM 14421]GEP23572.1 ABC transporter ATP-binding protein [Lentilactobacillus diolivorans]
MKEADRILTVNKLSIKMRHPILREFSYQFKQGQIYLIVATNGTGKTTFFRTITNLVKREQGEVYFDNQPFNQGKRRVFFYESSDWFDGNLSGLDYLKFVKQQWHSNQKITDIISDWGMTEYIKVPIKKYSLGMKQHVLIAMYFISNADYLVMDEISNGLDENSRKLLYSKLQTTAKQKQKCIIISSHYRSDMTPIVDHILELKDQVMKEVSK